MKVAYLNKDGFDFGDKELPKPGPNEILVKTIGCGICGGDQHMFRVKDDVTQNGPLALGHEGTGTVIAKGEGVEHVNIGDIITSLNGAFSDHFVARTDDVIKLPQGIDPLVALGEPVACCVHACERTKPLPEDRVAVVGCGFMGLLCLQIFRAMGARHITAFDPVPYRREMAKKLGADVVMDPAELDPYDPDTGIFDLVLEAAGNQPALDMVTDLVTHHGRVNLVGYHESGNGARQINMQRWNYKAIEVVNGHVRRDDEKHAAMATGLTMMQAGTLQTEPLVAFYPLSEIQQAFDDLLGGKRELFKIVLVPEDT